MSKSNWAFIHAALTTAYEEINIATHQGNVDNIKTAHASVTKAVSCINPRQGRIGRFTLNTDLRIMLNKLSSVISAMDTHKLSSARRIGLCNDVSGALQQMCLALNQHVKDEAVNAVPEPKIDPVTPVTAEKAGKFAYYDALLQLQMKAEMQRQNEEAGITPKVAPILMTDALKDQLAAKVDDYSEQKRQLIATLSHSKLFGTESIDFVAVKASIAFNLIGKIVPSRLTKIPHSYISPTYIFHDQTVVALRTVDENKPTPKVSVVLKRLEKEHQVRYLDVLADSLAAAKKSPFLFLQGIKTVKFVWLMDVGLYDYIGPLKIRDASFPF